MSGNKYESIRIPILKKAEYPTWRVKMLMFLEATDPDYIDRINEGQYKPTKLVPQTTVEGSVIPEHYALKDKKEWTNEEKAEVLKDAKVRNILHNSLDSVMSNRVIACKTAKEIWDALEVQCQGTKEIKKNRRSVLIQEYEYFEAKQNESLTETYDRFLTLLNDLALVDKEYDNEDSNTKFLRALPEEWDLQTSLIRDRADLEDMSLDEVYGRLKTHDLELQQRKNRKNVKTKSVALNVETKAVKIKEQSSSASKGKGKAVLVKESSESESEANSDVNSDDESTDSDMMEMVAMIVKGFKKMKYRKFRKQGNFQKKSGESENRERYKKREDRDGKTFDKSKVKCYKCNKMGHFATECRSKEAAKALITSNKDWMDSSDSEEETSYALMANTDPISNSDKVPDSIFNFNTDSIYELKSFLRTLHVSFKTQSLENERLKTEIKSLSKKNSFLESELVHMLSTKKDCENAINMQIQLEIQVTYLKDKLAKEKETFRVWTNSGKKTHELMSDKNWKSGLGYESDKEKKKKVSSKEKAKLTTPVNFVKANKEKDTSDKSPTNNKNKANSVSENKPMNIGLLSQKQLKEKLKPVISRNKPKKIKRNRNGKVGITKENDYKIIPDAPRKTCFTCGNTNHLAIDCRQNKRKENEKPNTPVRKQIRYKPQNPCFHCGSLWHSIYICKEYHSLYHGYYELLPHLNKTPVSSTNSVNQRYVVKNDKRKSNSDHANSVNINSDLKTSAAKVNSFKKKGSKLVWVLKTTN